MANPDNSTPHSAAIYDAQVRNTIPHYDLFHQETLNLIKAMHLEPKNWLDTGCGTGTLVQKASPAFPKTHFILADPSKEMLKIAKSKLAGVSGGTVDFLEPTDTQNLPRDIAKLDVVTAIQAHHYGSPVERRKATRVCFDLLVPGGVYVTFENICPLTELGLRIGKENWRNFQLSTGKDAETVDKHLQRFGAEFQPITVEEHLALLRETGFSTVEMLWYSVMQAGFYAVK